MSAVRVIVCVDIATAITVAVSLVATWARTTRP